MSDTPETDTASFLISQGHPGEWAVPLEIALKIERERNQANEHLSAARYFLEKYIVESDEARQIACWLYKRLKQVCIDHPLYGNVDGILARLEEAVIDDPWLEDPKDENHEKIKI